MKVQSACGEDDISLLSPQMISRLIEKTTTSGSKEVVISAKELFPQGYEEYIARVLEANFGICEAEGVYKIIAEQIGRLKINGRKCFDKVEYADGPDDIQFKMNKSEDFYMVSK